jgi:hypothetical protein
VKCHKNKRAEISQPSAQGSQRGINPKLSMPQSKSLTAAAQQLPKGEQTEENTHRHKISEVQLHFEEFCYPFGVSEKEGKAEDELMRALELELAQKRLRWQQDREKYRTLRILSFSFLSLVILAGLIGFFFFFTRAKDAREQHPAPSPTLSQH